MLKKTAFVFVVAVGLVWVGYAQGSSLWNADSARMATKIEMSVDEAGNPLEIEFHIKPEEVPETVRNAMDALHPGGPFTDAEREYNDGVLYFELSREVDGLEVEAMFTPEGELYSEEISVAADTVPQAVKDAIAAAYADGTVTNWEEIRNGARELTEYHVKLAMDGKKYKVMVSTAGSITGAYLEVPAEIEVPVR